MMLVLALLCSYLVGAIPFGLLIAKARGVDLRAVGSGNIGATNAWRALGPGLGSLVFALDVLKGLAGPMFGRWLIGPEAYGAIAACAMMAVVGHTFPIFLKFKGGKGVATGLGMAFGMLPWAALCAFALWGVVLGITRYISVASVIAVTFAAVWAAVSAPWPYKIVFAIIALVVWIKHVPNLRRLKAGTEPRVGAKAGTKAAPSVASSTAPPTPQVEAQP